MRPLCPTCREPVTFALDAVDLQRIMLAPEPLATVRNEHCKVLVNGYAWRTVDIVAAIAIETSVPEMPDALLRALRELDWHLPHICAGKVPVPA